MPDTRLRRVDAGSAADRGGDLQVCSRRLPRLHDRLARCVWQRHTDGPRKRADREAQRFDGLDQLAVARVYGERIVLADIGRGLGVIRACEREQADGLGLGSLAGVHDLARGDLA